MPPSSPQHRPARVDFLMVAVVVAMMTYVWRLQDLYPFLRPLQLPALATLCALGLYFITGDPRRRLRLIKHPITTCITGILLLCFLSVPLSLRQSTSLFFITDDLLKNYLMAIVLAASVRAFDDVHRYAAAMLSGAVVYATFVYLYVPVGESGRLGNIVYYDANDLGMLLVSSLPLVIYFIMNGRSVAARTLALPCLPVLLIVIIKTGSRGAFLGIIAVALYYLFKVQSIRKAWRVGAVVSGILVFSVAGSEQYWGMMNTLLNPQEDYNWSGESETGRMEIWKRGMGYMLSHPITGTGVATFEVAEGTISPLAERQNVGIGVRWASAHNSYVEIGAEIGVAGLILFLMLLYRSYYTARHEIRRGEARTSERSAMGEALGGAVIGYAVTGFFLSQAFAAFSYFIFALIIGLAKTRRLEENSFSAPRRGPRRTRRVAPRNGAGVATAAG